MNRQINTVLAIAVIIIIASLAGFVIWQGANNQQNSQTSVKAGSAIAKKNAIAGVVYKFGKNVVSYDPKNQQEKIIFSSDKLVDFDVSRDGKYLAYSLKEDGFEGNSDIYFLDIANQKTVRLTEKNNIASLNPKIYSDGKKVAYLRRTFDEKNGKLRDGEIWTIDASGDVNSSVRLFGNESKSWFELDPKTRCCTCDKNEELYEPKSMLELESISNDGSLISYKEGNFELMCFAGFQMDERLYDLRKKVSVVGTKILQSRNNEYYAQMYSAFPSDPFPFCIKNTFFDKNGKIAWAPEGGITDSCRHENYYKPLDFEINGNKVDMIFLKESNGAIVLSKNYFILGSDIENYLTQENPNDVLYAPRVDYADDGRQINYSDNILSAKQAGDYLIFLEKKFKSEYPILNIMDIDNKKIQNTIELDNDQNFSIIWIKGNTRSAVQVPAGQKSTQPAAAVRQAENKKSIIDDLAKYGEKTKRKNFADPVEYQAPEIGSGTLVNDTRDKSIEKWYFVRDGKSNEKYLLIMDDKCLVDSIGFMDGSCLKYLNIDENKNFLYDGYRGHPVTIHGKILPNGSIQASNITILQ